MPQFMEQEHAQSQKAEQKQTAEQTADQTADQKLKKKRAAQKALETKKSDVRLEKKPRESRVDTKGPQVRQQMEEGVSVLALSGTRGTKLAEQVHAALVNEELEMNKKEWRVLARKIANSAAAKRFRKKTMEVLLAHAQGLNLKQEVAKLTMTQWRAFMAAADVKRAWNKGLRSIWDSNQSYKSPDEVIHLYMFALLKKAVLYVRNREKKTVDAEDLENAMKAINADEVLTADENVFQEVSTITKDGKETTNEVTGFTSRATGFMLQIIESFIMEVFKQANKSVKAGGKQTLEQGQLTFAVEDVLKNMAKEANIRNSYERQIENLERQLPDGQGAQGAKQGAQGAKSAKEVINISSDDNFDPAEYGYNSDWSLGSEDD